MRRLSLCTVVALTAPAIFCAPAAFAQYETSYGRGDDLPAAIALFGDKNFYGDIRDAYDPFANLHDLAFNDQTRSVAVFAGQWELCEHKNFTGRCVFIREDVSDLGWFGLAGRVSSVRPIYEYTEAAHGLLFSRDKYGYIRYANNESYGYDTWNYGYASSWGLSVFIMAIRRTTTATAITARPGAMILTDLPGARAAQSATRRPTGVTHARA